MDMTNTPTYIYEELKRRNVPVEILHEPSTLMQYKHKGKWHYLIGCLTEDASLIGSMICNKKYQTEMFASKVGLPVPKSTLYRDEQQALEFIRECGHPIVVKPIDSAGGSGITMNVSSKTSLRKAIAAAKKASRSRPMLQETVQGDDLRILVIGGKYAGAVRRVPAMVVGDGKHTVEKLIEIENSKDHRSKGKSGKLKIISIKGAQAFLRRRIGRIPQEGEVVKVVGVSNTSMGGHAEDATDDVPTDIRRKAEKFARLLKLPACGIDIMMQKDGTYHFIEANARPGFGPHHHPRVGKERNVTKIFVDYLLRDN